MNRIAESEIESQRSHRGELRAILAMTLPTIVITTSRTIVSFTDMAMVRKLGTEAAASLMPASVTLFILVALGYGLVTAVNTFASQSLGRGRPQDGALYAVQSLIFSVVLGLVSLPLMLFAADIAGLYGHAPAVRAMEEVYLRIAVLSVGPSVAAVGMGYFFVGIHRPRLTMYSSLFEIVANFVGNYILIYGHFGAPALGVAGCAWSTVAASVLRLLLLLAIFWSAAYRREFRTAGAMRFDQHKMRELLRIGWPVGVQFGIELVSWTVFVNLLVGRFGTAHLAANNFLFQFLHISFMPAVGIGMALTSLVGKAIGQGDPELAVARTWKATGVCIAWMGACGLSFLLWPRELMGFWTDDADVIALGAKLMLCAAVFQVFDALCIAMTSALRGAGDTFWPAVYNTACCWGIMVGGGAAVARWMPQHTSLGPWVMSASYIIVLGLLLLGRFLGGRWRRINIFREPQPEVDVVAAETASVLGAGE